MYTAGPISKPKFPEDHAEWTRKMAQQGYARIAAENAAKAEKQAEKERRIAETRSQERSSTAVDDMSLGPEGRDAVDDGTGVQKDRKKKRRSVFGFLKRGTKEEEVIR
ncbi:hypothetical protein MMC14_001231 [Varicellaria rhodocarpa]|nr:hypothetical protein [Varicellaria rhodocarpa]